MPLEILSKLQKEILSIFSGVIESEEFYLTGGTALSAFYLMHRKSDDLDFFTDKEDIITTFSYRLESSLKAKQMTVRRQRSLHSFVELVTKKDNETTVIHLALDTPFRIEQTKEIMEYPELKIDSLVDIAGNKLLALFGRANLRDFIDVYFLVEKGKFTKNELIEKSKMKDTGFDLYWLGVAFERINIFREDSPEMLLLVETIDFQNFLNFFNQWREEITKQLIHE